MRHIAMKKMEYLRDKSFEFLVISEVIYQVVIKRKHYAYDVSHIKKARHANGQQRTGVERHSKQDEQ